MPADLLSSPSLLSGIVLGMLFIWLLCSAALTMRAGVKPPRMVQMTTDRAGKPDTADGRPAREQRVDAATATVADQAAEAASQETTSDAPGSATLTRDQRSKRRADPPAASIAARADVL